MVFGCNEKLVQNFMKGLIIYQLPISGTLETKGHVPSSTSKES